MKRSFKRIFLIAICCVVSVSMALCQEKDTASSPYLSGSSKYIPLEDFFRNPAQAAFKLSPDGKYLSYLAPYRQRMNIFIKHTDNLSEEAIRITSLEDRSLSDYFWINNSRLAYLKDKNGDENYHLYAVDVDGSNNKDLTPLDGVRTTVIDDLPEEDDFMIIGTNKRDPKVTDPYRINVNTGELTLLYQNPGNILSWKTNQQGKLLLATTSDGVNITLLYRPTEGEPFKEVITSNFREGLTPQFFDPRHPHVIYAISNIGRDKAAAVRYDLTSKKEVEVLYSNKEADITGISYSRKREVPTAVFYSTDKMQYHFLDRIAATRRKELRRQIPEDMQFNVVSTDKQEESYLVLAYNDKTYGTYYFYNEKSKKLSKLADTSPWLKQKQLADMKPVQYIARDGLLIHGYLTLPKGVPAKNLPVVVCPHGGPWSRDQWGFNPEVQFLVSRGFAVLKMNFRGSTGYGKAFTQKGFKQWGQAMQDDITDGVLWMIGKGMANPKKIAIYGGSYGGYATLVGITKTPDLYACAIDYCGVSNLFTFIKTIPPYWQPLKAMMYATLGDPSIQNDSLMMIANSPVFQVDKIKCPLFIAQGAMDPRVKKNESDQMVAALKARGVFVEYLVKENEGHGFYNEENKFDFYLKMESFLLKHLGEGVLFKSQ